jgi:alpha-glucosidase
MRPFLAVHSFSAANVHQYTLFAQASTRGTPPVRPLFFEFLDEPELLGLDKQFLVGGALLVTPVLEPNVTSVKGVIPGGPHTRWRDWWTHEYVSPGWQVLDAPIGHINVHLRDGSIFLLHKEPSYTTTETAEGPYELLVSLDQDGHASGWAYLDDGISEPPGLSRIARFEANMGALRFEGEGEFEVKQRVQKVTVLGLPAPQNLWVGNEEVKWKYDGSLQRVVVDELSMDLNEALTIRWE